MDDDDYYTRDGRHDPRFDVLPDEVPAGSVALALGLLAFGACSLVLAWLHWTQALFGKEQAEVGFTIVGLLTIIPGAFLRPSSIGRGVFSYGGLERGANAR